MSEKELAEEISARITTALLPYLTKAFSELFQKQVPGLLTEIVRQELGKMKSGGAA